MFDAFFEISSIIGSIVLIGNLVRIPIFVRVRRRSLIKFSKVIVSVERIKFRRDRFCDRSRKCRKNLSVIPKRSEC